MRYHGPAGSTDPNAGYIGKSVVQQRQGSRIPPAAIEFTQREIVNTITMAGISPTDDDLYQLARAIRSGQLVTLTDTSTIPGVITVGSPLQHTAYLVGLPLTIVLNNDVPTNGLSLNLNNLGAKPVFANGGGQVQRADYLKGDILEVRFSQNLNGFTVMTPVNGYIIDTAVTKSVHGPNADFVDLNEANLWKSRRRVGLNGLLTFKLAAGVGPNRATYNKDITWTSHPDGLRIVIEGQAKNGNLPVPSALRVQGIDQTSRNSDRDFNLATLRQIYTSEINFTGLSRFYGAGDIGWLQDTLFTSDGATAAQDNVVLQYGQQTLINIASVGATNRGITTVQSYTFIKGSCFAIGCGVGVSVEGFATMAVQANSVLAATSCANWGLSSGAFLGVADFNTAMLYAAGCGTNGISANGGTIVCSRISVAAMCGAASYSCVNNGTMNANGCTGSGSPYLFQAGQGGYIDASNGGGVATSGSGTIVAFRAFIGGLINRFGTTATAGSSGISSPAVGTIDSNGASIY